MARKATTHKRITFNDVKYLEDEKKAMEKQMGIKLSDPEFFTLYIKENKRKKKGKKREDLFSI